MGDMAHAVLQTRKRACRKVIGRTSSRISRLQQSAERLPAVAPGAPNLVDQFAFTPRRFAARIPLVEQREGILVRQQESAHQPAAGAECGDVAVLTADRRRQHGEVSARALDHVNGQTRS